MTAAGSLLLPVASIRPPRSVLKGKAGTAVRGKATALAIPESSWPQPARATEAVGFSRDCGAVRGSAKQDLRGHRQAGSEGRGRALTRGQANAHADPLDDLGEIARAGLERQQRELAAGSGREAFDGS